MLFVLLFGNVLCLDLGLICYKDFFGINWLENLKFLVNDGVRDFEDS